MLELLLAASMLYPPPSTMARGVHPAAWACSALELFDAPAGLSRLTAAGVHGWALAFENGPADAGVAGGLPLFDGRIAVGAAAAAGSDFGSYALAAGASYVLTGDPIGFMEGLFGPSIVVGVSGGAVKTGGIPARSQPLQSSSPFSLHSPWGLQCTGARGNDRNRGWALPMFSTGRSA